MAPMPGPTTTRRPVVVGIAGGSGAGKTSVVDRVLTQVGAHRVAVLRHDRYYHDRSDVPPEERRAVNVDHPASFDDDLFVAHLDELLAGRAIESPRYDYVTLARLDETDRVEPQPIVLVEGILVLASPDIRARIDVKVFIDVDADLRLARRVRRDVVQRGRTVEEVLDQYEGTVRPMHLAFVEPSKAYADLIVPLGVDNAVGIDVLCARITEVLTDAG